MRLKEQGRRINERRQTVATEAWINLVYLLAAVLFILAFKALAHPRTAVGGNLLGAAGMALAVGATMFSPLVPREPLAYGVIFAGLAVGSAIGAVMALRVELTSMPEMVALLNGFGGLASLLVAGSELINPPHVIVPFGQVILATAVTGLIGAVTFTGSLVAFLKLSERITGKQVLVPLRGLINSVLGLAVFLLAWWLADRPEHLPAYWLLVLASAVLGVLLTIPIGGADMPVVICLLNSYSGLAAAATGFVLNNNALIISGSLVGASGIILTRIMCRAMNRSLTNVLFGVMAPGATSATAEEVYGGKVKSASPEELAMIFETARRVVIVPGYGLAVAQAQHAVRELADLLESRGCDVEYAIHPVAGRMPGHMNVLLAEADIPYNKLREMDDINPTFPQTDVALVIGANDVVNPLARTDPTGPIGGMPILDVDKARTVIVVKRSLSSGFAGLPNPLFAADNTLMLFGDGKKAVLDLITALKES
jgi:NAD(P) transhydrogenase subunit beta